MSPVSPSQSLPLWYSTGVGVLGRFSKARTQRILGPLTHNITTLRLLYLVLKIVVVNLYQNIHSHPYSLGCSRGGLYTYALDAVSVRAEGEKCVIYFFCNIRYLYYVLRSTHVILVHCFNNNCGQKFYLFNFLS